ncbi:hypothetical protein HOD19_03240 [bacterium]|nr:hypothetical protein [bacterium]
MDQIKKLCTKSIFLESGKFIQLGPVEDIIKTYFSNIYKISKKSLANRKDRKGNGEVRFSSVKYFQENKEVSRVLNGKETIIEVEYMLMNGIEKLNNIDITIAINNSSGQQITLLSSISTNNSVTLSKKRGKIRVVIFKLPLVGGDYSITLFMESNKNICDWIQNSSTMKVVGGNFFKSGVEHRSQGDILMSHSFIY